MSHYREIADVEYDEADRAYEADCAISRERAEIGRPLKLAAIRDLLAKASEIAAEAESEGSLDKYEASEVHVACEFYAGLSDELPEDWL